MIENWLDLARSVGIGIGSAVLVALVVHVALRLAGRRVEWARTLVESNRGAKDKSMAVIARLLPAGSAPMGVVRPFYVVH